MTTSQNSSQISSSQALWADVLVSLESLLGKDAIQRWFSEVTVLEVTPEIFPIQVPDDTHVLWIETNYFEELCEAVAAATNTMAKPILAAKGSLNEKTPSPALAESLKEADPVTSQQIEKKVKQVGLNPTYLFDRFVVGINNRFAHAACVAVADGKMTHAYNPLFIYGGSGLGKTHLMQSIGHAILARNPKANVIYVTCEKFINEFIQAVQKGKLDTFRRKYRRADVMMIDDVQFLSGKERSQEEFFHTFNTLFDGQCQIVLTSDRAACEIQTLEPRLMSRFESGLTVAMQPPELETRIAILQKKMAEWQVTLNSEIVHLIADRISSNVRRLEGALVRVATYASLGSEENMTKDQVLDLLADILREEASKQVNIDQIQKVVSEYFDIRIADLMSRRRPQNIAFPRQLAMTLSRQHTRCSLVEIGDAFGGRDHGTVIHAVKKIRKLSESDEQLRYTISQIEGLLGKS